MSEGLCRAVVYTGVVDETRRRERRARRATERVSDMLKGD